MNQAPIQRFNVRCFVFLIQSFKGSVLNVTLLENSDFDTYTEVENYEKIIIEKVEVILFLV